MGSIRIRTQFLFLHIFLFFLSFSPTCDGFGSNLASCTYIPPTPCHIILTILNIVKYFYVHLTIPSILGLHPPYPTPPTTANQPPPPTNPPHLPTLTFFCIFTITSILHSHPPIPSRPDPPTGPPNQTPQPDPPPNFFSSNFTMTLILGSQPP